MKNLLMTLILAATVQSGATSVDMTKVLGTVEGREHGIVQIALLADARMQIVNSKGVVSTIQISPVAFDRLAGSLRMLAFADIKETHRNIVCKMMLVPTLSDLSVAKVNADTDELSSDLKLVLTRESCALSYEARPEFDGYYMSAREVRAELVILALNTLGLN